jgi:hypothetical protein
MIENNLYFPSTEIKILVEYMEGEAGKLICLSLEESIYNWSNLQLILTIQFATIFMAHV